jgi:hypothetical protein
VQEAAAPRAKTGGGMVQAGVHYGLRARAAFRHRRSRALLSAEDAHQPAAAATVGAGFRPGVMTKAELLRRAAPSSSRAIRPQ